MVVSFKVSKTGTRFRPKPKPLPLQPSQDDQSQSDVVEAGDNIGRKPNSSENLPLIADKEASFTLNLYSAGYSIGKPGKYDAANQSPKFLLPYDRSSETLFSAIESGHLPGDLLDDIPAKYVDGALICEVRDYRRCSSEKGAGIVSVESFPTVNKVCLKMSLENIVKDIPSLTDKSWTYGNIMEVESKILKALQPNLHLNPTPNLDRLCESPLPTKLNLQRKRLRNIPEFAVTSINKIRGKKVSIDRVQENSNSRLGDSRITTSNAIVKQTVENPAMQNLNPSIAMRTKNTVPDSSIPGFSMKSHSSRYPIAVGTPRSLQEHGSISGINSSGASSAAQDVIILYADNPNMSVSLHVKRDDPDGQSSPLSNIAKRMRPTSTGVDTMQQQQRMPHHSFTRPNVPQSTWNSLGQEIKKETKKEDQLQKRKHLQSPRLSRGTLPHSPLSSKSRKTSNGSVGPSFGPFSMNTALGALQKEKAAAPGALQKEKATMASHTTAVGTPSLTFSANDSTQRQQQAQLAAKQISNSLLKSPETSVVQKFPQQLYEGGLNQETRATQFASGQQGIRLVPKVEQLERKRTDGAGINRNISELEMDARNLDPQQLRLQQRMPQHAFTRPNFPQSTLNSLGQEIKKEAKKEDQLQKRKHVQSPRLSRGTLPHRPLSSKSGEFFNDSVGPSFGPSSMNTASKALQKEKAAMASHSAAPSLTFSANDSTQRQQQVHLAAKQISYSLPKSPEMSVVQKFPKQIYEGGLNQETRDTQIASGQQGIRLVPKVEQLERKRTDGAGINRNISELEMDARNLDPQQLRLQQRMPQHAFTRPNFPQSTLNSLGQEINKEAKKEDQLQKRKHVQSPRLSSGTLPRKRKQVQSPRLTSGTLPHLPSSSKSGEFSNDSVGPSFGPSSMNTAPGALQKKKEAMTSHTAAVGTSSLTFSANHSTQRQQQVHLAAKQISNSLPKSPEMSVVQKFPKQIYEGGLNQETRGLNQETRATQFASGQQGMRLVANVKQFEMERIDGARINHNKSELEKDARNLDPQQLQLQQRMSHHAFMRPDFPQTTSNSPRHQIKNEANKEDQLRKRKQVQSPQLSSGKLPHLPLSSKYGEFSNGSVGPSFGPSSMNNASGALQKEKAAMASHTADVGTPSLTCRANDSTQSQQAHLAAKQRSNSLPKTAAMSGVASPASVSTVPFNANSPSVGASDFSEQGLQNMFDRFSKVDLVTTRHKLHFKMKNPGPLIIKQNKYAPQRVAFHLANATNNEGLIDESNSLSKSLSVGSMNTCKMRVLSFIWNERVVQGNVVNLVPRFRTRMMMAENPSDGTVALHYGDIDDNDFIGAEEYLPTLSNTHFADLLADQYSSQIEHEGYVKEDDRVQLRPNLVNLPFGSQSSLPPNKMQQYGEPILGQSCNEAAKLSSGSNASLNLSQYLVEDASMLPPENPQALQMSQEFISGVSLENPQALHMSQAFLSGVSMAQRPHRLGSQQQAVQQLQQNQHSLLQQQNPQFQRSFLSANQLSHLNGVGQNSNVPLGNHMFHNHGSTMGVPLLSRQTHQQASPQKMSQQTPMSPQQMWSNYWLA